MLVPDLMQTASTLLEEKLIETKSPKAVAESSGFSQPLWAPAPTPEASRSPGAKMPSAAATTEQTVNASEEMNQAGRQRGKSELQSERDSKRGT
jgi:hypothetical protein